MLRYCMLKKRKPVRYSSLKRVSVEGSRHAVKSPCAKASPGQSTGKVIFKEQYTKITAFYISDFFRPKVQAREIFFFQAS